MTSYLHVSQGCSTSRPTEARCTRSLGLGYKLCVVMPAAGQRTHGPTFRALKVTSCVAAPGAESAVHDCLVHKWNTAGDMMLNDYYLGAAPICRSQWPPVPAMVCCTVRPICCRSVLRHRSRACIYRAIVRSGENLWNEPSAFLTLLPVH